MNEKTITVTLTLTRDEVGPVSVALWHAREDLKALMTGEERPTWQMDHIVPIDSARNVIRVAHEVGLRLTDALEEAYEAARSDR